MIRVHESDWTKNGIPFYRAREIVSLFNNEKIEPLHISQELYETLTKKCGIIKKDNLLVTGVGTIGIPYLVKENDKFYFKDGNIIWFKNQKLDGYFLYYAFQAPSIADQIKSQCGAGTVGTYTIDSAKKTTIFVPNMIVQNKIGYFLSIIDERIKVQNKIIEEMRSLRKAIYFNAIKTVSLKELIVSDICEIGRGRVINQQEIAKQKVPKYPVFSSQTLNNGIMGYLDNYDFDGEYITWTTDGANAGTVFYHNERFNCTNVCGTLKVKNEKVLPYYLYIALSHVAKKHVSKNLGNPKLMNGVMKKIVIKIPDSLNQNKIVNCLKTYDKLIKNEENLLECYKKQKQYFLDSMFI